MSCSPITSRAALFLKKPTIPAPSTCAANRARIISSNAHKKCRAIHCCPTFFVYSTLVGLLCWRCRWNGTCRRRSLVSIASVCCYVIPGNLQEWLGHGDGGREQGGPV